MIDKSITSASAFIENSLAKSGLSLKDAFLGKTVILPVHFFWTQCQNHEGFSQYDHPYFKDLFCIDNVLFQKLKVSSPLVSVQVEELCTLGVKGLIGLGVAGSIHPKLEIGDIVISTGAINETGTGVIYGYNYQSIIPAHYQFANKLFRILDGEKLKPLRAIHWATDCPYRETLEKVKRYRGKGAVCVEMEGAGLFAVANTYKIPAVGVYVVSDRLSDEGWQLGFSDERFKAALVRLTDALIKHLDEI